MSSRLLVLAWHNVNPTWCFPARAEAGQRGLAHQLAALRRVANVLPLEQALRTLSRGEELPPRSVALSFDDGYRDNLTIAAPVLSRLGLPATFFLVPGLLSHTTLPWWEVVSWAVMRARRPSVEWADKRLPLATPSDRRRSLRLVQHELKKLTFAAREEAVQQLCDVLEPGGPSPRTDELFLDWDEARELVGAGFSIGSHTCQHAILGRESRDDQEQDLVTSRRALQEAFDQGVELLAYPNGTVDDFDHRTQGAASKAGYAHALTTIEGLNNPRTPRHAVKRVLVYPERGLLDLLANLRFAIPAR